MNQLYYILFAVVLAIVSIFTGEMVTFVMLGIILISLNNINNNLKKVLLMAVIFIPPYQAVIPR